MDIDDMNLDDLIEIYPDEPESNQEEKTAEAVPQEVKLPEAAPADTQPLNQPAPQPKPYTPPVNNQPVFPQQSWNPNPRPQQPVFNPAPKPPQQPVFNPAPKPPQQPVFNPTPKPPQQPVFNPNPQPPVFTQPTPNRFTPQQPKKKKSKGKGVLGMIALGLCCSLMGGIIGALIISLVRPVTKQIITTPGQSHSADANDSSNMLEGSRENSVIDITEIDTSKVLTPAEVYALNVNSTVGITTSITTNYWGIPTTSAASGSGFIISDDGYILTNFHVIENSNQITVALYDGAEYNAQLIGYDESNDIAVLKVDAQDLTPVILGDSDNMNVGDPVVAIGNPLGELTFSLTSGTVSAMSRTITMSNGVTMDLMQTDCAINSGNSGGALFNLYGEVIGITNAKYSSSGTGASIDNIGFAIPMNDARDIFESIIEKGYISKPYIGVSVSDVSEESQSYGLPAGAAIRGITEDSPAEKAGLKEGDIITHVNEKVVSGSNELVSLIRDCEVGDELTITIYRKNETIKLKLIVGEQTQSAFSQHQ